MDDVYLDSGIGFVTVFHNILDIGAVENFPDVSPT